MARVELRDGWRDVPDHLAALMAPLSDRLHLMTYEEAVKAANDELLRSRLNDEMNRVVVGHLRRYGN